MDSDSEEFDESVFGLSDGDSDYEDVAVVGDAKPTVKTHQTTKLKFKQTSLRHLDELKNTLGLADFQDKAAKKSEKRRRQKERRKLKKTEGSSNAQIQTKATKLKETAAKVIPEVVTYLDPKKRPKKAKKESFEVDKDEMNGDDSELTMKQARFDVFKFGIRGLDKDGQHDARVALALRLGAKPDKKSCLPYDQYKEKIANEKSDKLAKKEMDRLTGMRKASTRPASTKRKNKNGRNDDQNPAAKKKKKHNEATPLKFGKFDGGTVRISKKEINKIQGKK